MLEQARAAVGRLDAFKAKARMLAEGLESELAVAVDVMFPIATLTAAQAFKAEFPTTPLRLADLGAKQAIHMRDHPPGPAGRWFIKQPKLV